jgi:hypothetical protein
VPYGGTSPAQDVKIERCVQEVMAKGQDKVSAIRICKSAVLRSPK